MSRKDSLIQIETVNIQKLTEALKNLLVRKFLFIFSFKQLYVSKKVQDIPVDHIHLLQNSDLTNDNERIRCIEAATSLTQALSVQLQPGLENELANKTVLFLFSDRNGKNGCYTTKTRST